MTKTGGTLSGSDRQKIAGALSKLKQQKAVAEALSRLDGRADTYRQAATAARDPSLRQYAVLALEAVQDQRQAVIKEALKKDPAALDAAIDALDRRLR